MNVLVISRGVVGKGMASSGVRSYHIARVLAQELPEAEVTLAVPNETDLPSPHPRMRIVTSRGGRSQVQLMREADVIVSRNFPPTITPFFFGKRLALDFFTSFFIEWMYLSKRFENQEHRRRWMESNQDYLDAQLTLADYIFCSNERQRDLWVGALAALGLVTPAMYDRDPMLADLISVIPYGVQPGSPHHTRRVLKGVMPGIRESDKVLIWNGLVVEWFDANTVVRAMGEVSRVRDDVKLVFMGIQHPDLVTSVAAPPVQEAMALARELGIYERSVFFNVDWVPYQDIGNYLVEADIGVCAAPDNLEARYSFRTRYVDLFWADLPVVCSRGDVLAERVERDPIGVAVDAGDHEAFTQGILRLVEDGAFYERCRANSAAIKEELRWERTLQPLVEFCRSGKSYAAPKRRRIVPLVRRFASYLRKRKASFGTP